MSNTIKFPEHFGIYTDQDEALQVCMSHEVRELEKAYLEAFKSGVEAAAKTFWDHPASSRDMSMRAASEIMEAIQLTTPLLETK